MGIFVGTTEQSITIRLPVRFVSVQVPLAADAVQEPGSDGLSDKGEGTMAGEDATHYSILGIDIEGFTQRDNPAQISLRDAVYDIVRDALRDVGLDLGSMGHADTGDGMLIFFPASVPAALLVGPLLRALDDRLGDRAKQSSPHYTPRLRVALHHGLVHCGEHGWTGDAVNYTCRLLDGQPPRDVLAAAVKANMVFISSDEVFQAVIRHDYRATDPAAYCAVRLSVKQMKDIKAWLYIPGYPNPPGLAPELDAPGAGGSSRSGAASTQDESVGGGEAAGDLAQEPTEAATAARNQNTAQTVQGNMVGEMHVTITNPGSVRL